MLTDPEQQGTTPSCRMQNTRAEDWTSCTSLKGSHGAQPLLRESPQYHTHRWLRTTQADHVDDNIGINRMAETPQYLSPGIPNILHVDVIFPAGQGSCAFERNLLWKGWVRV